MGSMGLVSSSVIDTVSLTALTTAFYLDFSKLFKRPLKCYFFQKMGGRLPKLSPCESGLPQDFWLHRRHSLWEARSSGGQLAKTHFAYRPVGAGPVHGMQRNTRNRVSRASRT